MENMDGAAPEREYGPRASLLKRRVLGGVCIALVLAFLWFIVAKLGGGAGCQGCTSFGSTDSDGSVTWLFAVGAVVVVAVSLIAPVLAARGVDPRTESEET